MNTENDNSNIPQISREEVWRRNVSNLADLIATVMPGCVFMLTVIPDPSGRGMYNTHNIRGEDLPAFAEAQRNLAQSMCDAHEMVNEERTIN
jgi:hypothetical protein